MDRAKFQHLANQLLDTQYKNPNSRNTYNQKKKRGKPLPKISEDNLTYVAKPKLRACDDCSIITTNSVKSIYIEEQINGTRRWMKRCLECKKRFIISKSK